MFIGAGQLDEALRDFDAAVGGWIEIEWAEVLRLEGKR